jgi:pimeloyl-ACP methyl ester carboxylesterase
VLAVAAALLLAACGSTKRHAQSQPRLPRSLDGCVRAGPGTKIVRFPDGAGNVPAAAIGTGRTGVVLANESDLDLCGWLPFARRLAGGSRVLLWDYGNAAPEVEAAAAARELKRLGSTQIVLAGASEGAKAAIVAAAAHPSLAQGVVALSPEASLGGQTVAPSARRLAMPALFAVSEGDPFSARDTPALEQAAGSARKRLVVVPGDAHGVALLRGAPAATVGAAFLDFVRSLGAPRHPQSLSSECGDVGAPPSRPIAFTAGDGVALTGDVLGSGDTAVVLAHEFPSSLCGWFPYASELARAGLMVLAFDSRSTGARLDLDLAAAVDRARALGATRVVAMGASMGGAATLLAGGRDCFLVSGLVSVSGETDLRAFGEGAPPLYAVPWEPRISAPLLVVGSKGDPLIDGAQVRTLLHRAASRPKSAVLVDGSDHGWSLLQGPSANAQVRAAVLAFLRRAGNPVPTGCTS